MCGMTYKEYWEGNPYLVKFYYEKHQLEIQLKNEQMWLQGLYNYNAFSSVIERFGWGLGGKKGEKPQGYMEYPIAITEAEKEAEKQREIENTLKFFQEGL